MPLQYLLMVSGYWAHIEILNMFKNARAWALVFLLNFVDSPHKIEVFQFEARWIDCG